MINDNLNSISYRLRYVTSDDREYDPETLSIKKLP